jgi:hypothetical protein
VPREFEILAKQLGGCLGLAGMLRDKAGEFGHAFRAGVAEAAARVAAFGPDLVVFFGSDHRPLLDRDFDIS